MSAEVNKPGRKHPKHSGPNADWLQVTVQVPPELGHEILEFLKENYGFQDIAPIDWCELERAEDFSRVSYAPCKAITKNRYSVDWRKGQGRGNVHVKANHDTPSS